MYIANHVWKAWTLLWIHSFCSFFSFVNLFFFKLGYMFVLFNLSIHSVRLLFEAVRKNRCLPCILRWAKQKLNGATLVKKKHVKDSMIALKIQMTVPLDEPKSMQTWKVWLGRTHKTYICLVRDLLLKTRNLVTIPRQPRSPSAQVISTIKKHRRNWVGHWFSVKILMKITAFLSNPLFYLVQFPERTNPGKLTQKEMVSKAQLLEQFTFSEQIATCLEKFHKVFLIMLSRWEKATWQNYSPELKRKTRYLSNAELIQGEFERIQLIQERIFFLSFICSLL